LIICKSIFVLFVVSDMSSTKCSWWHTLTYCWMMVPQWLATSM